LTAEPVAVRVAEGAVVVVLVGGTVVVVLAAGADVDVLVDGEVVVVDDELGLGGELALPLTDVPVEVDVVVEPCAAEALERDPSVRGVDFVWNVSTPISPTTVAPITTGARLIEFSYFDYSSMFASSVT
jgi:hypothetical protein